MLLRLLPGALLVTAFVLPAQAARLDDNALAWLKNVHLIELQQGSELSNRANSLASGGYELANGQYQPFREWYASRLPDMRITWLGQVTQEFGLIFGLSTGERGKKYTIDPSVKLGFIAQAMNGRNTTITLQATTILGGMLREKTCTADYGEIGGTQEVNCRLAATTMQPADTLTYLVKEKPANRVHITLSVNWKF